MASNRLAFAALSVAAYDFKKGHLKEEKTDNDSAFADWVIEHKIVDDLAYDSNGRLTFKNKVVRMYSISKLRRLNAQRMVVQMLEGKKDRKPSR